MHPLSFIRGALFGAFVMYLFAPRSGAETRRMFSEKTEDLKNTLGDIASTVTNDLGNSGSSQQEEGTGEEAVIIATGTYRPMTFEQP